MTSSVITHRAHPAEPTPGLSGRKHRYRDSPCPGCLADLTGTDPADAESLAVHGKAARGSRHDDTPAAHLLAAMTDTGQVISQIRIPDNTNEITCFPDLLGPFDLTDIVVTADALHTQRDHARFLVEEKKAHFVLTVKKNQLTLHERLRRLPWNQVTVTHYDRSADRGRKDTPVVKVLTLYELDFPHVVQVARVTRHSMRAKTGKWTRETVYVITSLTSQQASPG